AAGTVALQNVLDAPRVPAVEGPGQLSVDQRVACGRRIHRVLLRVEARAARRLKGGCLCRVQCRRLCVSLTETVYGLWGQLRRRGLGVPAKYLLSDLQVTPLSLGSDPQVFLCPALSLALHSLQFRGREALSVGPEVLLPISFATQPGLLTDPGQGVDGLPSHCLRGAAPLSGRWPAGHLTHLLVGPPHLGGEPGHLLVRHHAH